MDTGGKFIRLSHHSEISTFFVINILPTPMRFDPTEVWTPNLLIMNISCPWRSPHFSNIRSKLKDFGQAFRVFVTHDFVRFTEIDHCLNSNHAWNGQPIILSHLRNRISCPSSEEMLDGLQLGNVLLWNKETGVHCLAIISQLKAHGFSAVYKTKHVDTQI